ncbi:hypothetical protein C8R47DRAFT_437755 [Mycena vitilis]|nr:hypothetical protein C8R47DRAFT_437755 [Mycena vitilis]
MSSKQITQDDEAVILNTKAKTRDTDATAMHQHNRSSNHTPTTRRPRSKGIISIVAQPRRSCSPRQRGMLNTGRARRCRTRTRPRRHESRSSAPEQHFSSTCLLPFVKAPYHYLFVLRLANTHLGMHRRSSQWAHRATRWPLCRRRLSCSATRRVSYATSSTSLWVLVSGLWSLALVSCFAVTGLVCGFWFRVTWLRSRASGFGVYRCR